MSGPGDSITSYRDIEGWFSPTDKFLFDAILATQGGLTGTLVELGTYLGRSAVVIADHRQPGDRFVVVDLFGSDAGFGDDREDEANRRENLRSYERLTQERFEANFRALHPELPEVVQGLSSVVTEHVPPSSARFVHVDASHTYHKVAEDIAMVAELMMPGGVVVLDDFRAPHTPGVAAATWEAVHAGGLNPIATSNRKFYGTWGDPVAYREAVVRLAADHPRLAVAELPLREHTIARVWVPRTVIRAEAEVERAAVQARRADVRARRLAAAAEAEAERRTTRRAERAARRAQAERDTAARRAAARAAKPAYVRLAREWTPPAIARWARARRAKRPR